MKCSKCSHKTAVKDNRLKLSIDGRNTFRRRECIGCGYRFVTQESIYTVLDNRKDAFDAGHRRYNTGRPCTDMHYSDRYTLTYECVECRRLGNRATNEMRRETENAHK